MRALRSPSPSAEGNRLGRMDDAVAIAASFYDRLAPHYHLLYGDWERSGGEQGKALSSLLHELGVGLADPIHDAACGIGTQTIGLASLGHNVSASDISPGAGERLTTEIQARGLEVPFQVDDFRVLQSIPSGTLAAVLACDNSLPHLLSDAEIAQAFSAWWHRLRPGGVVVVSVRDYAAIPRVNPDVRPYGLHHHEGIRFLAVQVWEWDGEHYDLSIYLITEGRDGQCQTQVFRSRYYAVPIDRICSLLAEAGFVEIQRRDDVLFQSVLAAARKPHAAQLLQPDSHQRPSSAWSAVDGNHSVR
jgi:SAM-dependent methyltransferase